MAPLTVYKASAGSGKTFTLAVEYIKLLIENPMAFRQTLAVTFTNKATEEMKMRILSQLYGIWQGLDSSKNYTEKICAQLHVTPEHASKQAGAALKLLLHNYTYFRVETIDSFFQCVLRNLARELELTANLRIGLNDYQVEELAVDQLIDRLHTTDPMLQWLLRYIMENISEDRSWNVIGQIKQFGKTIFRDNYKEESLQLNTVLEKKDFFANYTAMLRNERRQAAETIRQIAATFFQKLEGEGLTPDDFANKSRGVCSIFLKMQKGVFDDSVVTKTVDEAAYSPVKWYAKSSPRASFLHTFVETELIPLLRCALEERQKQWKRFKSADLTLKHLSQLRLLGSIEKKVRLLNEEANRFLLSDTQQLLHDLIDGSDSPFIFEKIGTQLEHIMIDEFQDTSTIQWQNFKILLQEAMSHKGSTNLIVGDVKQSIYRWRSGDWRLLANIKKEFNNPEQLVEIKKLDTNFRSSRNIIQFNNAFFIEAAKAEGTDAYDDVAQQWPDDKPQEGLVCISLLPQENYLPATLDGIVAHIAWLMGHGVKANDIAILVRSNSYIPMIASYLMAKMPDTTVVSDEAFRLDASSAVMLIIKAIYYLYYPEDNIARAFLAKATTGSLEGELPEEYCGHTEELKRLPLLDLTERMYTIFIEPHTDANSPFYNQSAYLCAFFDQAAAYADENLSDAISFLREWEETISAKTIQSPEVNGLRIISIHKAKGLEFEHVIMPFCDWKMEHRDILWCKPSEEPFSQLPLVPIDYSKKGMTGTIYEKDYNEEHIQNTVDNLNLLYVAFTRASRSLMVTGKRGSKTTRSALLEEVLPKLKLEGAALTGTDAPGETLHFEYGCLPENKATDGKQGDDSNPFMQESLPVAVNIEVNEHEPEFRQAFKSQEFASDGDDEQGNSYIQLGSVLHNIFASIRTTDDIGRALKMMEHEGIIYNSDISRNKLEDMIRKRLNDKRVAEWFSKRWRVLNECSILLTDGQTRRPDRVMTDGNETIVVDYKFGKECDEHHYQVREYISLIKQMGQTKVKGYLWYVYSNKIVEVKETFSE